jgi:hypothetical protein
MVYDAVRVEVSQTASQHHAAQTVGGTRGYCPNLPSTSLAAFPPGTKLGHYPQEGGFDFTYDDRFVLALPFSLESYVQYTLTQSTITAAVEERGEDIGAVTTWLTEAAQPFFRQPREVLQFTGYIWYLQSNT